MSSPALTDANTRPGPASMISLGSEFTLTLATWEAHQTSSNGGVRQAVRQLSEARRFFTLMPPCRRTAKDFRVESRSMSALVNGHLTHPTPSYVLAWVCPRRKFYENLGGGRLAKN
ncbi:hypothetical protein C8R45DRAFT_1078830 [Mycena sanguinolenta]|nr:hypothetical protein C8R45DRAFT_1078830 [Mycena sanguinolenta]